MEDIIFELGAKTSVCFFFFFWAYDCACFAVFIFISLYKSTILIFTLSYPPAKTLSNPVATLVHAVTPSPTGPHPLPFTNTVVLPVVMGCRMTSTNAGG